MSNSKVGGYVVLVRFRTKDGQQQAFASAMQSTVPATRLEPGNRQYEFYSDQEDPLNFMLYEELPMRRRCRNIVLVPRWRRRSRRSGRCSNKPEMSSWTQT